MLMTALSLSYCLSHITKHRLFLGLERFQKYCCLYFSSQRETFLHYDVSNERQKLSSSIKYEGRLSLIAVITFAVEVPYCDQEVTISETLPLGDDIRQGTLPPPLPCLAASGSQNNPFLSLPHPTHFEDSHCVPY